MAIIVVILLLCVISLLIPVIYFTSQGVPLADIAGKVQEILPESSESSDDAAYKREMEKIKAESVKLVRTYRKNSETHQKNVQKHPRLKLKRRALLKCLPNVKQHKRKRMQPQQN